MKLINNIKPFDWKELDGKKLKISVSQDLDNKAKEMTTVVIGYEKSTGNMYTLHMETKKKFKERLWKILKL